MKISEIIKVLETAKIGVGDVDVYVYKLGHDREFGPCMQPVLISSYDYQEDENQIILEYPPY